MSNFKVGDVCMYKPRADEPPNKNFGKIFTLVAYMGVNPSYNYGSPNWKTDTKFIYSGSLYLSPSYEDFICESQMRKLDNPDEDAVDEMVALVGPAPKIKEVDYAV